MIKDWVKNYLYPDAYFSSAYQIDYGRLYEHGFRGIIFDVDNTLVEHGKPATDKAVTFFQMLHEMGFDTCILSNNSRERVRPFADRTESEYLYKAGKPSPKAYLHAMHKMHTDRTNTIFIGDQIFTDILGANRAGIICALVKPISRREEIQIILKRILEKPVIALYLENAQMDGTIFARKEN